MCPGHTTQDTDQTHTFIRERAGVSPLVTHPILAPLLHSVSRRATPPERAGDRRERARSSRRAALPCTDELFLDVRPCLRPFSDLSLLQQALKLGKDIVKLLMWRKKPLPCLKYPSSKHWLPYPDVLIHLLPQRRCCKNKGFAVSVMALYTCNNMLYALLSEVRGWDAI